MLRISVEEAKPPSYHLFMGAVEDIPQKRFYLFVFRFRRSGDAFKNSGRLVVRKLDECLKNLISNIVIHFGFG